MTRSFAGRPSKADRNRRPWKAIGHTLAIALSLAIVPLVHARDGKLELAAIDRDTGKPIAVRVHLVNVATKRPVRPADVPSLGDHFVFYDRIALELPLGSYRFVMERGPEYLERTGHFTINNYADDRKTVDMKRFVNMAEESWYAGDLDVRRSLREIELPMQAEDLYVAAIIGPPAFRETMRKESAGASDQTGRRASDPVRFDGQRFYSLVATEHVIRGNALLFHHLKEPLKKPLKGAAAFQSSLSVAAAAKQAGGWVDAALPFSWDLPLWIAAGKVDSVQVANRHLLRNGVVDHEAGGHRRDTAQYPGVQGNGRWSLDIYYHLLNCGLRLPPTAGSGSRSMNEVNDPAKVAAGQALAHSMNTNPLGYNRVYVFVDGELTWEKWWEGLRAGRTVVTNGPLIRPTVEGQPPGYVFKADRGQTVELEIGLSLSTRDKISYLEIVKDGAAVHNMRLDKWKAAGGKLPALKFTESGWFMVRAVTDDTDTFRFATTAPYYVEVGDATRISRTSAQFFVDWCREGQKRLVAAKFSSQREHDEVAGFWGRAEEYWTALLNRANAP